MIIGSRIFHLTVGLGLLLAAAFTGNFSRSTAHISNLKLGKDKNVSEQSGSFERDETIYAVATISNVSGKVKVVGRLAVDDVPGQKTGPIPGLETSLDMDGSGTASFNFSAPTAGWPVGKYTVEVEVLNEDGDSEEEKTISFTVS